MTDTEALMERVQLDWSGPSKVTLETSNRMGSSKAGLSRG